jgi:catechol 2,3-dioxygenase-like lactoylglutathione lyase family enzyme
MKTHLSFATTDLEKSVAFYSILLAGAPAKKFDDYALFVTDRPGLELALNLRKSVRVSTDAHYGICVENVGDVDRAIERLEGAGLASSIEREQTCCYATQTKVWAMDPDGRRWEVYAVHEDTQSRDDDTCCAA